MVNLEPHSLGVVLPVRAQAGASRSGLRGEQDGALKVAVTQIAERGKANKAIVGVLSKSLGLRKSQIELLSGETSPNKRFLIRETDAPALAGRIAEAIAGAD